MVKESLVFILIIFLIAVVFWLFLDIFRERRKISLSKNPSKDKQNELFLRISEEFARQLEILIGQELQKSIGEFRKEFQKTSEEIIKNYKEQFGNGSQEIQKEISNLSKFSLEAQNKISEETKTKIAELNLAMEKEIAKIQEANLKIASQLYLSNKDILNKKIQETEKEIENYKKERLKELDQKIYQLVGEVAKKTLGRAIDITTHERLVMEALEKAKKEIF